MPKKIPSFITRLQAEGPSSEKNLIRQQTREEALKLVRDLPPGPERFIYIKKLWALTESGKIDREVFRKFIIISKSMVDLVAILPRTKLPR